MMQVLQGSLEADAGRSEEAKRRLQALLDGGLDAEGHSAPTRNWHGCSTASANMAGIPAPACIRRPGPNIAGIHAAERALLPDLIRANTAGFDRALMERWSGADFTQERPAPVFLIGFFRSGTTLTQEVLDVHPTCSWPTRPISSGGAPRASPDGPLPFQHGGKTAQAGPGRVKHLRAFYWTRAQARFGDALVSPVFIDKFTLNTIDLGLINCIFPDAKVVFVMRDRATSASVAPCSSWCPPRHRPSSGLAGNREFLWPGHDLVDAHQAADDARLLRIPL